jgi:uncharacterized protein YfdQ (DUF2303 family)
MTDTEMTSAAKVIAELAVEANGAELLGPGGVYAFMHPRSNEVKIVNLRGDEFLDFPRRKRGTVTVTDVASFAQYHLKHSTAASDVFADMDAATVTAVLDAHSKEDPAWQEHRVTLKLSVTPEWAEWASQDRHMVPQQQFAEFIEDHIEDIAADSPAKGGELLDLAQAFHVNTKVAFSSAQRLATGETQFAFAETHEAKAGQRGTLTIPGDFALGIQVFEDSALYRVKARFRYRIIDGSLRLGYHLDDPARKHRDAVEQVVTKTEEACKVKVMRGRP